MALFYFFGGWNNIDISYFTAPSVKLMIFIFFSFEKSGKDECEIIITNLSDNQKVFSKKQINLWGDLQFAIYH